MAKKRQSVKVWYGFYFEGDEYYAFEERDLPKNFRKMSVGQILPMSWDKEICDAQCIFIGNKKEVDQLIDDLVNEKRTYSSLNLPPFKAVSKRRWRKRKRVASDTERELEVMKRKVGRKEDNICETYEDNEIIVLDENGHEPIGKSCEDTDGKNIPEIIEEDGDNICEYLEIEGENVRENFNEEDKIHKNQIHGNGESILEWNGDDSLEFDDTPIFAIEEYTEEELLYQNDVEYAEMCKRFNEAGRHLAAVEDEFELVDNAHREIKNKLKTLQEEKQAALKRFQEASMRKEICKKQMSDVVSRQTKINLETSS